MLLFHRVTGTYVNIICQMKISFMLAAMIGGKIYEPTVIYDDIFLGFSFGLITQFNIGNFVV